MQAHERSSHYRMQMKGAGITEWHVLVGVFHVRACVHVHIYEAHI